MRRSRRGATRALAAGAVCWAAISLCPEVASAYCRTSVCNARVAGQLCVPAQPLDCGTPLYWAPACFGVSVQRHASAQVDLATAEALVAQAFAAWENVDCAGARPAIAVTLTEPVSCDQQEYNQEGGNANIVMFRDVEWPYMGSGNTLALTTVTYNLDTGEIFDADLEVNSTMQVQLTTTEADVRYDVLSIITHEAGHMLGLAHSDVVDATMTVEYEPGHLELRSLHPDDAAAICAAYPPPDIDSCDPTPRHGFADECDPEPDEEDGCSCRLVGTPPGDRGAVLLLLSATGALVGAAAARRATRRRR
jgi:hypothetical protein